MKLFIIVGAILVLSLNMAHGLQFQCTFGIDPGTQLYTCYGTVEVIGNPKKIERISGYHLPGKTNSDVRCFDIGGQLGFIDFPSGLGSYFKNVELINLEDTDITEISNDSLTGLNRVNKETGILTGKKTTESTTTVDPTRVPDDMLEGCSRSTIDKIIAFVLKVRNCN